MATTFNFRLKPQAGPIYKQLADYFRKEITLEHLASPAFLPSIRQLSEDLDLSRNTIAAAYNILVDESYVVNKPGSGYMINWLHPKDTSDCGAQGQDNNKPALPYDFSNNYIDPATFDTPIWRRCLNYVLREPAAIKGYGDVQGELALRKALAKYSYDARGVVTTPEQIVVGAGLQSLLAILLPILPLKRKIVGLEAPGFPQAEQIFTNYGWQVKTFRSKMPRADWPPLLIISPSNPYKGRALSEAERISLTAYSELTKNYILEDDYNGEFRYLTKPLPALHSFGDREHIIYFGSFSRSLLPSLRISYMVLPKQLLAAYKKLAKFYNQTSSTVEQLALAKYINDGHLQRHVKKLRHSYSVKNTILRQALKETFKNRVAILDYASGMHLRLALHYPLQSSAIRDAGLKKGVKVIPVLGSTYQGHPIILLSFAGIAKADIAAGIKLWKKALDAEVKNVK